MELQDKFMALKLKVKRVGFIMCNNVEKQHFLWDLKGAGEQTWNLSQMHVYYPCKISFPWCKILLWLYAVCCKFSYCWLVLLFLVIFKFNRYKWGKNRRLIVYIGWNNSNIAENIFSLLWHCCIDKKVHSLLNFWGRIHYPKTLTV